MSKNFDFVAIGDTTIDAFIRLKEARVNCRMDHENCEICLRFADKIPYESVTVVPAVGNSPNAAVAAARLGLSSALICDIGTDREGEDVLESLKNSGVATDFVRRHSDVKTNYHYVLWYEDDRTILIKHEVYNYKLPDLGQPLTGKAKWIYLSSIGENSAPYHEEIEKHLATNPEVKLAFQPGTFQMKMGTDKLAGIYARTEIFFCNVEEAKRILGEPVDKKGEIKHLLEKIRNLGPKIVVITDGPRGAYVLADGVTWFMPPYPDPKPPLERTGAGDAFSSTFTAALALGKSITEALSWGPINSMSVVQQVGAQAGLLTQKELENYLKNAPSNYTPQQI